MRGQSAGLSCSRVSSCAAKLSDFQAPSSSRRAGQVAACASSAAHSAKRAIFENPIAIVAGDVHVFHRASAVLLRGGSSIRRRFFFRLKKSVLRGRFGHLQHPGDLRMAEPRPRTPEKHRADVA